MPKPKIRITIELEGDLARGDLPVTVKALDQCRIVSDRVWLNSLTRRFSIDLIGSEEILIGIGSTAEARVR